MHLAQALARTLHTSRTMKNNEEEPRKMTLVERYQQEKSPQSCRCKRERSLDGGKVLTPCENCNLLEVMRRLEQVKESEERLQRQQQKVLVVQNRIRPTTAFNGVIPAKGEHNMSISPVSMAHSFSPVSQRSSSPISTPHLPKLKPSTVRAGWLAGQGPLADAALLAKMKWVAEMKKTSPELTKIMMENMNMQVPLLDSQVSTATASPSPPSFSGSNVLSPNASTVNLFPIPQAMAGSSPSTHNNSLTSSPSDPRSFGKKIKPIKTINTNSTIHTPVIAPSSLVATYYAQAFSPITFPTATNSYTLPPDYLDTSLMDHSFNSTDGSMDTLNQLSDLSNAPPSPSMNMMLIQKPISKRPQTASSSSAPLQRRPNTASSSRSYQRPSSSAIRLFENARPVSPFYWGSMCDASMKRYNEGSSQHYSLRKNP